MSSSSLKSVTTLLEKLNTTKGKNLMEVSQDHRLSLTFIKWLGCPLCAKDIAEIAKFQMTFLRLNTIPVICIQEDENALNDFLDQFSNVEPLVKHLWFVTGITSEMQQTFNLAKATVLQHMKAMPKMIPLLFNGYKFELPKKSVTNPLIIFGLVLIEKGKIIKQFECPSLTSRPNYGAFLLEMEAQQGSSVEHIPKMSLLFPAITKQTKVLKLLANANIKLDTEVKDYETLHGVMNDKAWRKFFKMHMTNEQNVENLLFIEEVELFKATTDSAAKLQLANRIVANFLHANSFNELSITDQLREHVESELLDKGASDTLFNKVVDHVTSTVLVDCFAKFKKSPMFDALKKSITN